MTGPIYYDVVTDPALGTLVAARGEDGQILAVGFDGSYADEPGEQGDD